MPPPTLDVHLASEASGDEDSVRSETRGHVKFGPLLAGVVRQGDMT